MTLREQAARAIVLRRAKRIYANGAASFDSEESLAAYIWDTDHALMRGIAFADVDECLAVITSVDHAFLDVAREGLPLESGTAAKFWLACLKVLRSSE